MADEIETRPLLPADKDACERLVLDQPSRLGEETGLNRVIEAVRDHEGFVAVAGGAIAGFLTYDRSDPRSAEITWLAVRPEGADAVQKALLSGALAAFAESETQLVCVLVPESRGDVRALYESFEFVALCDVPSLDDLPGDDVVLARSV